MVAIFRDKQVFKHKKEVDNPAQVIYLIAVDQA